MTDYDLRDVSWGPIDSWPGTLTPYRRRSQFSALWTSTKRLLASELGHLGATHTVIGLALTPADFRNDGIPRAGARAEHPGVLVAFDSIYGPLKYAVDTFDVWQDNVRAIALAMQALRAVDRYGVTKRGEQYTGWLQLPQTAGVMDRATAEKLLAEYGGEKEALRKSHPDHGGTTEMFHRVQEARRVAGRY